MGSEMCIRDSIVISELKEMELEELIGTILENGIEEHGFYE